MNIRRLPIESDIDCALIRIYPRFRVFVARIPQNSLYDRDSAAADVIDNCCVFGPKLSGHDNILVGQQRLARHPGIAVLTQKFIQNGVGNAIGQFIRMTL
jgi:hypothetical protein